MSIILNGSWAPLIPYPDITLLLILAVVTILIEVVGIYGFLEGKKEVACQDLVLAVCAVNIASFFVGLFIFWLYYMVI